MNSLKTVLAEPRILADALIKGTVTLPANYWRTQLCLLFFQKYDRDDLFRILRVNFCPLFWVSNFLLLTFPLWGPIYGFIWLFTLGVIAIMERATATYGFFESRAQDRKARKKAELKSWKRTYDPKEPLYNKLRSGKRYIRLSIKQARENGIIPLTEPIPWTAPAFVSTLCDEEAYYASFCALYGDKSMEQYVKIIKEGEARYKAEEERAKREEREAAERARRRELLFTKIFVWGKKCFTTLALILSIPAAILIAYFAWCGLVAASPHIAWFFHFIFVTHLNSVLWGTGGLVTAALVVFIGISLVKSGFIGSCVMTPIGNTCKACSPVLYVFYPFKWIFEGIAAVICFIADFVAMFFSKNCPGITYEDEKLE